MSEWQPRRDPRLVLEDIFAWIGDNERAVKAALA
jgi:hypothetical protein